MKLKIKDAYKIGLDEVEGLQDAMAEVLKPVLERVKQDIYWNDDLKFEPVEYNHRDGFWASDSNCGGLEICQLIPKCEEYSFGFLEFGECEECNELCEKNILNKHNEIAQCGYEEQECASDSEGHLDAILRIWLKFEGIENGVMSFYLVMSGGNGDAPYFRVSGSSTYFESDFEAKTIAEFKREAKKHIKKLLKKMN